MRCMLSAVFVFVTWTLRSQLAGSVVLPFRSITIAFVLNKFAGKDSALLLICNYFCPCHDARGVSVFGCFVLAHCFRTLALRFGMDSFRLM